MRLENLAIRYSEIVVDVPYDLNCLEEHIVILNYSHFRHHQGKDFIIMHYLMVKVVCVGSCCVLSVDLLKEVDLI